MESEPENHTLLLLREMRHDDAEFRRDIVSRLERIESKLEVVSKVAAGESVLGRYASLHVQEQIDDLTRRLEALEAR